MEKTPRAGEIFYLTKDKPYQIITMGIHKETCESMVIYQALFGDYATLVLPLSKFMQEVQGYDTKVVRDTTNRKNDIEDTVSHSDNKQTNIQTENKAGDTEADLYNQVNKILLTFLDTDSYSGKLEVITTNIKAIDDRLINDMAASLDCTVEDGPMDKRIQELIYCLRQLSRFEVRRR